VVEALALEISSPGGDAFPRDFLPIPKVVGFLLGEKFFRFSGFASSVVLL